MKAQRIVSLLASATEMVCALGRAESLVGRSHECDYPPAIQSLPLCSIAQMDASASSLEIDRQVKRTVLNGLSLYELNVPVMSALEPTLILTQSQCAVCAVSLEDVEKAACSTFPSQPRIVSLSPNSLADVWQDLRNVAAAIGEVARGEELLAAYQARLDHLRSLTAQAARPRVACIEWIEPLMGAGNWVPELVEIAGGTPVLGKAGTHSGWLEWPELQAADPDVLIVSPCGFDLQRTRGEMIVLDRDSRWQELRAVQQGNVFLIDGNQYLNRSGPRLVDTAEILAAILQPTQFSAPHLAHGWQRWPV